jgi:hypothetical protein
MIYINQSEQLKIKRKEMASVWRSLNELFEQRMASQKFIHDCSEADYVLKGVLAKEEDGKKSYFFLFGSRFWMYFLTKFLSR